MFGKNIKIMLLTTYKEHVFCAHIPYMPIILKQDGEREKVYFICMKQLWISADVIYYTTELLLMKTFVNLAISQREVSEIQGVRKVMVPLDQSQELNEAR